MRSRFAKGGTNMTFQKKDIIASRATVVQTKVSQ